MIFGVFLVAMITVTSLGFKYGDVDKFLAPIDQNYLICGHANANNTDKSVVDYKYLYLTNLAEKEIFTTGWCVEECPKDANAPVNFAPIAGKPLPDVAGGIYGTVKVFNYCMPVPTKLTVE